MSRKITSLDVAAKAGVSQSAVSRVFTPGSSVSDKMARKVRVAAEELGYRPNVLARSLITGSSRIIGLVVAYLDNPFYADALQKLSHALDSEGYHILVFMAGNTQDEVDRVIESLMDYQVDGIITASINLSGELAERCATAGIPVVCFNRSVIGAGLSAITSDNRAGGAALAAFLAAGGHRRIAHISGWQGSSTGQHRAEGFAKGLAAAGHEVHAQIDGMFDRTTAIAAAQTMMEAATPPDAIFVGNDHMALAVMDHLRFEMGLRVPLDVSIVGYDDVPMAAWQSYALTTVRQPARRMVEATVKEVLARITTPDAPVRRIEIDGPLMVRGSARLPKEAP
jgi:DNA-binding LacI/PurR family transcriptional regulator